LSFYQNILLEAGIPLYVTPLVTRIDQGVSQLDLDSIKLYKTPVYISI